MTETRISLAFTFLAALLAACGQRPATAETARSASADMPDIAAQLASLPLKHGYYVASDTACAQASNATLSLVTRRGINASQQVCEFQKIELAVAGSYRVSESCADIRDPDSAEVFENLYTLQGDATFSAKRDDGWAYSARYCEQAGLPDPWRHNDISDIDD